MFYSILINILMICGINVNYSATSTGSNWEVTDYYYFQGDLLKCIDYIDCTLKCYGRYSCGQATIRGPKGASLTVYCDSWYYAPANAGGSCYQMDIIANESTTLDVYVYNGQNELYWSYIFAPNNGPRGGYSTNIVCGLIGTNSPGGPGDANCGYNCRVWAYEGWNDVSWTYSGSNSWALIEDQANQIMYCGLHTGTGAKYDYQYNCYRWTIQNDGRYGCKQFDECDSYVMPTDHPTPVPSKVPSAHPTPIPTGTPTKSPTDNPSKTPTGSPTTLEPSQLPTTSMPSKQPTQNPSKHPTIQPTLDPTSIPTIDPTFDPTSDPTKDPTLDPTTDPSSFPTIPTVSPTPVPTSNPTTSIPTKYPTTAIPSNYPTTTAPTDYPTTTIPTRYPTFSPTILISTINPTVYSTIFSTSNGIDMGMDSSLEMSTTVIFTLVGVGLIVILLILILIFCILYLKVLKPKSNDNDPAQQLNNNVIAKQNNHRNVGEPNDIINNDDNYNAEGEVIELADKPIISNVKFDGNETTTDDVSIKMDKMKAQQKIIKKWFKEHVKLNEANNKYYNLFMLNGYDDISLISKLNDGKLIKMGVDKMAHRDRILEAITTLNNRQHKTEYL